MKEECKARMRKGISGLTLLLIAVYLVTGAAMSTGFLDKNLARSIHVGITLPFVILLLAHVVLAVRAAKAKAKKK